MNSYIQSSLDLSLDKREFSSFSPKKLIYQLID